MDGKKALALPAGLIYLRDSCTDDDIVVPQYHSVLSEFHPEETTLNFNGDIQKIRQRNQEESVRYMKKRIRQPRHCVALRWLFIACSRHWRSDILAARRGSFCQDEKFGFGSTKLTQVWLFC